MKRVFPKGLLTDRQALVFHSHEEEGLSRLEIAERLGVSVGAVTWFLREARLRVRDYEANGVNSLYLVPKRLRDFLETAEMLKPEDLRAAIQSGSLHWSDERHRLEWKDYKPTQYYSKPDAWDKEPEDFSKLIGQHIPPMDDDSEETLTLDEPALKQEEVEQKKPVDIENKWHKNHSPRNLGWKSWQQMHERAGLPITKREGESDEERKVRSAADLSDEELLCELERRPHLKRVLRVGKGGNES